MDFVENVGENMAISKRKKQNLCSFQDDTCEQCKKKFEISNLHIHRIIRKGDYNNHRILMVVCKPCHRLLHGNEFPNIKSK
jgi:hypothetical protein